MRGVDERIIYEVATSLIGEIEPVGSTHIDKERKNNLKTHISLMNMLVDDVMFLIDKKVDYRASVKEIGNISYKELKNLVETLSEALEGEE